MIQFGFFFWFLDGIFYVALALFVLIMVWSLRSQIPILDRLHIPSAVSERMAHFTQWMQERREDLMAFVWRRRSGQGSENGRRLDEDEEERSLTGSLSAEQQQQHHSQHFALDEPDQIEVDLPPIEEADSIVQSMHEEEQAKKDEQKPEQPRATETQV